MSKTLLNNSKIIILQEIREKKEQLFGPFSSTLTKQVKTDCWKEVNNKCGSLGLVVPEKDWTYTRDVFWQNLKKATVVRFS